MSRKLEKFIGDNRNQFDDKMPSDKLWNNIAAEMVNQNHTRKILTPFFKWLVAGVFILTSGVIVFFAFNISKKATPGIAAIRQAISADSNTIEPESVVEVSEFAKLVVLKQKELKALAPAQPELYKRFSTDINQLNSSYQSLKEQLNISPNHEMLIESMIQNLQLQLHVLDQQLKIIQRIKKSKNENQPNNPSA